MNRKWSLLWASLAVGALTAGCSGVNSVFSTASTNAQITSQLIRIVFGIAAVVFVVVEGLLLYTVFRFRSKHKDETGLPTQVEGNQKLEIGWTAVPAVILAIVFGLSIGPLRTVSSQPALASGLAGEKPLVVRVVGRQWFWEFDYTDDHIVTANELHIPVGVPVRLDVQSADVIHSFWVPELGGKMDVIPGHINTIWIKADQAGTYPGQCAEFCGVEHAKMRLEVVAEDAASFKAWILGQQAPVASPSSADAAQGEKAFLDGTCSACHTITGTKARGQVGPNLTHFASRQTFAGGTLPNTPQNLSSWLSNPQAVKPGNLMPNLHLPESEIQQLVAFLESLK